MKECCLIKDLLPLYHDGVVSEESRQAVEAHLNECESCRAEYERLFGGDGAIEAVYDDEKERQIAESYKKVKRKRIVATAILSLIAGGVLFAIALFAIKLYNTWPVYPQPMKNVENVDELSAELEKDGVNLLVPDPALLQTHSAREYSIAIDLTNRTRSAKAIGYLINGTSSEGGYDWTVSAVPAPGAWAQKDEEYHGTAISKESAVSGPVESQPGAGRRYVTTYHFVVNQVRYTVQGYVWELGRSPEKISEHIKQMQGHLMDTIKDMLDRGKFNPDS